MGKIEALVNEEGMCATHKEFSEKKKRNLESIITTKSREEVGRDCRK